MANLKPVDHITPPHWMKTAPVLRLMEVLNGDAARPRALFVGGCVRNEILGAPVTDIDIATSHAPEQVSALLSANGFKVIPTGIEHGTVTAVRNKDTFEITTLRRDIDTDGRHATVAYSEDWHEDARRRDFTMNTLLADTQGQIFDPIGQGLGDARAGRVIFVGDAAQRIAEDHLRILRFFRCHALYGQGAPDSAALSACKDAASQIKTLSRERITQETFKILSGETPFITLDLMFAQGVLAELQCAAYSDEIMAHICLFQNRYDVASVSARLLALAGFDLAQIEVMEEFLLIPKVFKKDMKAISAILAMADLDDEHSIKTAIYKHGRTATTQALMIQLAQDRVMNGFAATALDIIQNWDVPNCPHTGKSLMAQGYKPGPELGAKLDELEQAWIENGFAE